MVSHPELGSDPPIGSDRESGCDSEIFKEQRHFIMLSMKGNQNIPVGLFIYIRKHKAT